MTHTAAKQLLPVANKPVLFYGLEAIRDVGITEVGMIVGDTADEIQAAVGDGSAFGLDVTYLRQEAPLGLAHAVIVAREYLGDDDFIMYLGDNFLIGGLGELVDSFCASRPDAQIMLTRVPDPHSYGVAELNGQGRVVSLEEKPKAPKSDLALVGIYIFTPAVHEAVLTLTPSWRGELEITEAIQWLIDSGLRVASSVVTGYWKDTGSVSALLEVNRLVLETVEARCEGSVDSASELIGRIRVEPGAQISGSRIVGPAVIAADSRISGSYIGPFTSIASDCVITDSEIEYSIVLSGATLLAIGRVEASLIGRGAEVTLAPRPPRAHRLLLGDDCKVQIAP